MKATHVFDMFVVGYLNCVHGMVSICVVFKCLYDIYIYITYIINSIAIYIYIDTYIIYGFYMVETGS